MRRELKAGRYEKAVEICRAGLKGAPGKSRRGRIMRRRSWQIKAAGDKALDGRDYAAAGRIHGLLLNNLGSFELEGWEGGGVVVEEGAAGRGDQGLPPGPDQQRAAEYREGDLEKAIEIWDSLSVFDPGNAEIQKAVETAKAQLGKVKRVGVGPQHQSYFK